MIYIFCVWYKIITCIKIIFSIRYNINMEFPFTIKSRFYISSYTLYAHNSAVRWITLKLNWSWLYGKTYMTCEDSGTWLIWLGSLCNNARSEHKTFCIALYSSSSIPSLYFHFWYYERCLLKLVTMWQFSNYISCMFLTQGKLVVSLNSYHHIKYDEFLQ